MSDIVAYLTKHHIFLVNDTTKWRRSDGYTVGAMVLLQYLSLDPKDFERAAQQPKRDELMRARHSVQPGLLDQAAIEHNRKAYDKIEALLREFGEWK